MKPGKSSGERGIGRGVCIALALCIGLLGASGAQAQSAYGCVALETSDLLPAVEGADGTFFAIRPELQAHHSLGDATIAQLARLSDALAERGTQLVVLAIPTRAQVMADKLPPMASDVGFELDLSLAVHEDMLARLEAAGLRVADPRAAMRAAALSGGQPFFKTDPRPTPEGMKLLAQAVAAVVAGLDGITSAPGPRVEIRPGEDVTLASDMRTALQRDCNAPLPAVVTARQEALNVAGADPAQSDMIVVGTAITATAELNFPGFLSQETGLVTLAYGVPSGGAFAAISSYMTSTDYQSATPKVLVWEWPVAASMAARGPQPLDELILAARGGCETALPLTPSTDGASATADLSVLPEGAEIALALDTADASAAVARFHVTGADGLVRTRSLYRHPDQILTGQFFMTLSDLAGDGFVSVEIETDRALSNRAALAACVDGGA